VTSTLHLNVDGLLHREKYFCVQKGDFQCHWQTKIYFTMHYYGEQRISNNGMINSRADTRGCFFLLYEILEDCFVREGSY